ncbi:Transcriptional regulator ATRX [Phytophthora megakarya]|uniref:Transcriptional regulator ATRX n=1 Tax=Phytophthora megakarya TaxID=4795 RepID=A0A225VAW7_9STRA|nr:Transcriptional regulator ATRX [Phytophthora megakarya]
MQAIFDQQQRDNKVAEKERFDLIMRQKVEQQRLTLARKQAEIAAEKRKKERLNMKLSDRHLLVLRRGIKGCQDLKRKAEECGATLAIEINSQLTDIVSAMSKVDTLKWLKLNKLPGDIELHDDVWLRNEIAKEKGLPLIPVTASSTPATTDPPAVNTTTATVDSKVTVATTPVPAPATTIEHSPQTTVDSSSDFIDLLDSDDEEPPKGTTSGEQPASNNNIAAAPDEVDVIEIL